MKPPYSSIYSVYRVYTYIDRRRSSVVEEYTLLNVTTLSICTSMSVRRISSVCSIEKLIAITRKLYRIFITFSLFICVGEKAHVLRHEFNINRNETKFIPNKIKMYELR